MTEIHTDTPRHKNRKWVLAGLLLAEALAAMDGMIVSTAIPQIVADLGGFSLISWLFSGYLLAQLITVPIYGKLSDVYGRKPILIIGTIIFLIGSLASACSWNMLSLTIFRGVQGIGAGAILATVTTLAGDLYSIRQRAYVEGWLSTIWGISAILGPAIGGALIEHVSWHWIFLINLPFGILSILLFVVFLHEEKVEKEKPYIDFPGAAMFFITGAVFVFTLMRFSNNHSEITANLILLLVSAILILVTIYIEKKSPDPIMPGWIWKDRILSRCNFAAICLGAIILGPSMYVPLFSQTVLELTPIISGFTLACISIGWPIASSLSGHLYMRIDFKNTALIGVVLIALASIGFLIPSSHPTTSLLIADQILLGLGFGLAVTPIVVGVQSIVPWNKRGVTTAVNMFSFNVGQSIGATILGGVFNLAMSKQLSQASDEIKSYVPQQINDLLSVFNSTEMPTQVKEFLNHTLYISTYYVYIVMAFLAVIALLFLLQLPKKFPIVEE